LTGGGHQETELAGSDICSRQSAILPGQKKRR
jgi:hypothetical protein